MTETGFDWRRLTAPAPEVHAEPVRSGPILPIGRWLAVAGLVACGVVTSIVLAISAPSPEVVIGPGADVAPRATADPAGVGGMAQASPATIMVDVDGAVMRPGLVALPAMSRVGDAIAAAGGFAPAADARAAAALNLAATLVDGDQVTVPDRATAASGGSGASTSSSSGAAGPATGPTAGPIDIDHATAAELEALPGIGPVTAGKILAARDEVPFTSVDDLLTRKLVGPATFEKVKTLVTADGR